MRKLIPAGTYCTLQDCPPGPFLFNGCLGFKTEYGRGPNLRWPEAYCMESGEAFWGGVKTNAECSQLIVTPLQVEAKE